MVLSAATRLFIILNITGRSQIDHVYLKRRDVSSDVPKYALTWLLEIERRIRSKMLPKGNSVEKLRIGCWKLLHRSTGAKQTRANWRRFAIRRRHVFSRGQFQFLRRRVFFSLSRFSWKQSASKGSTRRKVLPCAPIDRNVKRGRQL